MSGLPRHDGIVMCDSSDKATHGNPWVSHLKPACTITGVCLLQTSLVRPYIIKHVLNTVDSQNLPPQQQHQVKHQPLSNTSQRAVPDNVDKILAWPRIGMQEAHVLCRSSGSACIHLARAPSLGADQGYTFLLLHHRCSPVTPAHCFTRGRSNCECWMSWLA